MFKQAAASLLAVYVSTSLGAVGATPAEQQPAFRSAVDVIAVDVLVLDRAGRPVADLPSSSFEVTIDGRRRQVTSAQFVRYLPEWASAPDTQPTSRATGSNVWPSDAPSRSFVLAIDTASFSAGESASVVQAARRFIDRLSANDMVGVHTLPHGTVLPPTTDRVAVRRALSTVIGMQTMRPGQFHLTPAEVVDITAANGAMESVGRSVGRGQVAAPTPLEMNEALRQVQLRECRTTTDQACLAGILVEADGFSRQFEDEAEESLTALEAMLATLADYPARRTVILLSGGIPISDRQGSWNSDGGQARKVGQTAARANATIYALHVDHGISRSFAAEARKPGQDQVRERQLEELLLSQVSETSGGTMLSAPTGTADVAFDQLLRETSAYYLLGVSPAGQDLDGRTHALKVRVPARGTVVRSRQFVWLPKAR
jgi:VWFA-related protein